MIMKNRTSDLFLIYPIKAIGIQYGRMWAALNGVWLMNEWLIPYPLTLIQDALPAQKEKKKKKRNRFCKRKILEFGGKNIKHIL